MEDQRYTFDECEITIKAKGTNEVIKIPASCVEFFVEIEKIEHFSSREGFKVKDAICNSVTGRINFTTNSMVTVEKDEKTVIGLIREAIRLQNDNKMNMK